MVVEYLGLVAAWTAWGALHSLLIAEGVRGRLRRALGARFRYYRLAYNAVAVVTVAPVVLYARGLDGPLLWRWDGALAAIRLAMLVVGAALLVAGARRYDMRRFLGLRQLDADADATASTGAGADTLAADGALDTGGILGVTRHPWYLAAFFVVWADRSAVTTTALLEDLVLSAYLVVGTVLEERKLEREFGAAYRAYRREVSALLPLAWLRRRLTRRG